MALKRHPLKLPPARLVGGYSDGDPPFGSFQTYSAPEVYDWKGRPLLASEAPRTPILYLPDAVAYHELNDPSIPNYNTYWSERGFGVEKQVYVWQTLKGRPLLPRAVVVSGYFDPTDSVLTPEADLFASMSSQLGRLGIAALRAPYDAYLGSLMPALPATGFITVSDTQPTIPNADVNTSADMAIDLDSYVAGEILHVKVCRSASIGDSEFAVLMQSNDETIGEEELTVDMRTPEELTFYDLGTTITEDLYSFRQDNNFVHPTTLVREYDPDAGDWHIYGNYKIRTMTQYGQIVPFLVQISRAINHLKALTARSSRYRQVLIVWRESGVPDYPLPFTISHAPCGLEVAQQAAADAVTEGVDVQVVDAGVAPGSAALVNLLHTAMNEFFGL